VAERLARWIDYFSIDRDTEVVLAAVLPLIEPRLDEVLDIFYDRIDQDAAASALFVSPKSREKARAAQRHHWLHYVLRARFDEEYRLAARAIGRRHYELGVDLLHYVGAYSVFLDQLSRLVEQACQDSPFDQRRTMKAINQVAFLDMGLSISVYYDTYVEGLETLSQELIFSLARAGEFRDNDTGLHLMRMSMMCRRLAQAIGQTNRWANNIMIASRLHDVGKIGITDGVLLKPGRLDETERAMMQQHPLIGGQIIPDHPSDVIGMARRIALTHHEHWNGAGYPIGLRGEEIPLEGRIAAICDVYDALLSRRPYKDSWSAERVEAYLRSSAGHHFDPRLIDAFLALRGEMDAIRQDYSETEDRSAER
jgi:putative two-component system response regulator